MQKQDFNRDWSVCRQGEDARRRVNLPHDAMIHEKRRKDAATAGASAYFAEGTYEYRKSFFVPEEWKEKTALIEFEGIYQNASVFVNGKKAAERPYGYSNFFVDLNGYLEYGAENEIMVEADNSQVPNSRWYSGSGIYREVHLYLGDHSCIAPEGIQVTVLDQNSIRVDVNFWKDSETSVEIEILDQGKVVASSEENHAVLTVENAHCWNAEDPYLYECRVRAVRDGEILDEDTISFGMRTISWGKKGFLINGQPVLLRGACIHHDNGILGACAFADAEERRVRILKEAGFNAIRSAHNPISKAMLDACDRLGMYVMDETFDMWIIHKNPYDYGDEKFRVWWEKDVAAMVDKDFNHPSVVMYSIGNEISELGISEGQEICRKMADFIRKKDSGRPVTCGINLMLASMAAKGKGLYGKEKDGSEKKTGSMSMDSMPTSTFFNVMMNKMGGMMEMAANGSGPDKVVQAVAPYLDICGYNYAASRYKKECKKNPDRVIVGSETLPKVLYRNWKLVEKYPNLIGDFMWTGWDYLGESGIGTVRYTDKKTKKDVEEGLIISGGCGIIDLCGKKRPEVFWGKLIWGLQKDPVIGVDPMTHADDFKAISMWRNTDAVESWSWEGCEGKKNDVVVYADAAYVELSVNGKPVGKQNVKECKAFFKKVAYEPGKIMAIAYDASGWEIGRTVLESAVGETQITLRPEKTVLKANGQDLCFLDIDLQGENGVTRSASDQKLRVQVEGAGTLQAFGSARPNMAETFVSDAHTTYYGKALAVIRAGYDAGQIRVTVSGEGLETKELTIEVKAE